MCIWLFLFFNRILLLIKKIKKIKNKKEEEEVLTATNYL